MVSDREAAGIRRFVSRLLRGQPDLRTLTLGILRKRYLAHVGCDSLSADARNFMKQVVQEELMNMQDEDKDGGDVQTTKPQNKRKREEEESDEVTSEKEEESSAKKFRPDHPNLSSELKDKEDNKTGSEQSEDDEDMKSGSDDDAEKEAQKPEEKKRGRRKQQKSSSSESSDEEMKDSGGKEEKDGSSGESSKEEEDEEEHTAKKEEKKTPTSDEEEESDEDDKKNDNQSDDGEKEEKVSVEKKNSDSDSSSLPSLEDDENSEKENTQENKKEKKPKKKEKKDESSQSKKDGERAVVRLKRYISLCGVRRNYKKLLEGCHSVRSKVAALKKELEDLGVHGQPSIEKCKKVRMSREEAQELADLDVSNIITTQGRPKRRAAAASWQETGDPPSSVYQHALDSSSGSDQEDTHRGRRRMSEWANLRGIISDDADSD